MFSFDKTDLQRIAVSSLGAIALTTAAVAASSAHAATPVSTGQWQAAVTRQVESQEDHFSANMESGRAKEAVLAVRFTADGDFAGASIARSSGNAALDAHAVQVANRVKYPQMPAALRGQPQTIAMRLVFGRADTPEQYAEMTRSVRDTVRIADAAGTGGHQVAVK